MKLFTTLFSTVVLLAVLFPLAADGQEQVAANDDQITVEWGDTPGRYEFNAASLLTNDDGCRGSCQSSRNVTVADGTTEGGAVYRSGSRVTYRPPHVWWSGEDSFTYTLYDGEDRETTATVTLTVPAAATAPTAENDELTLRPGEHYVPVAELFDNDALPDRFTVDENGTLQDREVRFVLHGSGCGTCDTQEVRTGGLVVRIAADEFYTYHVYGDRAYPVFIDVSQSEPGDTLEFQYSYDSLAGISTATVTVNVIGDADALLGSGLECPSGEGVDVADDSVQHDDGVIYISELVANDSWEDESSRFEFYGESSRVEAPDVNDGLTYGETVEGNRVAADVDETGRRGTVGAFGGTPVDSFSYRLVDDAGNFDCGVVEVSGSTNETTGGSGAGNTVALFVIALVPFVLFGLMLLGGKKAFR